MKIPFTFILIGFMTTSYAYGAQRTEIQKTNTINTKTQLSQTNRTKTQTEPTTENTDNSDELEYTKSPMPDEKLEELVILETKKLNALVQSTIRGTLSRSKNGDVQLATLGTGDEPTISLREAIGEEAYIEAERRKREMQEIVGQALHHEGVLSEKDVQQLALKAVFPVETTLEPKRLPSRFIKINPRMAEQISTPLAIIGADTYSLAWFRANIGQIRRLHAGVIVTQVDSLTDFQALQKYAPDLQFQPLDAKDFLALVGISVYPIIVTREGAIQ